MGIRDWFKPKAPQSDSARLLMAAREVVSAYGELVEHGGSDIHDERELPYPKDVILKSLQALYAVEQNAGMKEALLVGASTLAHYQPNIGPTPLYMTGVPVEKFGALMNMPPGDAAKFIVGHSDAKAKFDQLFPKVREEAESLVAFVRGATSQQRK